MASIKTELEKFTDEFEGELEKRKIMGVPITRSISIPLLCCCGVVVLILGITLGAALGGEKDKPSKMEQHPTNDRQAGFLELLEPLVGKAISEEGTAEHKALIWLANDDPANLPLDTHLDYLTQRYVLANIYEATGGRDWKQTYSFMSYRGVCEWNLGDDANGAICEGGIVTQLVLQSLGLNGTVPHSLGLLTHLQHLILDQNALHGTLPKSLGLMTQLTHLGMHGNHLSGQIPTEIAKMAKLEQFDLHTNRLSGDITVKTFGTLRELRTINVGFNQLTGQIPFWGFDELPKLFWLNVQHNQIGGEIKPSIGQLSSLGFITLNDNQIGGSLPNQLVNMHHLNQLHLHNNQFTGRLPQQWDKMTNLVHVQVDGNSMTGTIPSSIFEVETLRTLNLGSNGFDGKIPTTVGEATGLQILQLDHNQLTGSIPKQLGSAYELTELDLSNNLLTGRLPTELAGLGNIEKLHLNHNRLQGEIPTNLDRAFPELIEMTVSHNHLFGTLSGICDDRPASFQKLEVFESDCQLDDVICSCCTKCCDETGYCCDVNSGLCSNE